MTGDPAPQAHEAPEGIARLEGFLWAHTDRQQAAHDAHAFAERLPWLTTDQREEVVRVYTEVRLTDVRSQLRAVIRRSEELRSEYSARYEQLKRRVLCTGTALLVGSTALCCLAAALLAAGR